MKSEPPIRHVALLSLGFVVGGCAASNVPDPQTNVAASQREALTPADVSIVPSNVQVALPLVRVHKSPTCGCCEAWVAHMRAAGFAVSVQDTHDLQPIKERLGVPHNKTSCHTAEIGGYVVEGHVPADDVKRLLTQRPNAKGLVVPGMPMGSPGMESPNGRLQPYTVELVDLRGNTSVFAQHGQ